MGTLCLYFNVWVFLSLNYRGQLCRLSRYIIYFRLNITVEISSRFDELKSTANTTHTSNGFTGRPPRAPPSTAQNFLNFMQFFAKLGKIICWRLPGELAPPPTGNPGSAPVIQTTHKLFISFIIYPFLGRHPPADTSPRETHPPGRHTQADTPQQTPPPQGDTSPGQTHLGRHPLGRHPIRHPLADSSHDRHPLGRQLP